MADAVGHWIGQIDYPMYIVTVVSDGQRAGCLVGFSTQCSINPIRFLVCLSSKNHTYRVAQRAQMLALHLVPSKADALVALFGSRTGDQVDKFEHCAWHDGPAGLPVLDDCPNWLAGPVVDRVKTGDHMTFLIEPTEFGESQDPSQFDFHRAKALRPGHEA